MTRTPPLALPSLDAPAQPADVVALLDETLAALAPDHTALRARLTAVRQALLASGTFSQLPQQLTVRAVAGIAPGTAAVDAEPAFRALAAAGASTDAYLACYLRLGGTTTAYAALAASPYPDPSPAFVERVTGEGHYAPRVAQVLAHCGPASAGADHALRLLTQATPTWWRRPFQDPVRVAVAEALARGCFAPDGWFLQWAERRLRAGLTYHRMWTLWHTEADRGSRAAREAGAFAAELAAREAAHTVLRSLNAPAEELAPYTQRPPAGDEESWAFGDAAVPDAEAPTALRTLIPHCAGLPVEDLRTLAHAGGETTELALAHPAADLSVWAVALVALPACTLPAFFAAYRSRFHEPDVADAFWAAAEGLTRLQAQRHGSLFRQAVRHSAGTAWLRGVTLVGALDPSAVPRVLASATGRHLAGLHGPDLQRFLEAADVKVRAAAITLIGRLGPTRTAPDRSTRPPRGRAPRA